MTHLKIAALPTQTSFPVRSELQMETVSDNNRHILMRRLPHWLGRAAGYHASSNRW